VHKDPHYLCDIKELANCEYSMDKKCFKHKPLSDCCCIYYSQKKLRPQSQLKRTTPACRVYTAFTHTQSQATNRFLLCADVCFSLF